MAAFAALYDANVPYPAELRNSLMQLAMTGLFRAKWSAAVKSWSSLERVGMVGLSDGMCDVPGEVEFCVKQRAPDVRHARLLALANPRLLGIFAVTACAVVVNMALNHQYTQVYIFPIICIFMFAIVWWVQAIVSMRNPVMQSPFCHRFSPLGISTQFLGGSLRLEWSNIKKAAESKQYVAVYGKRGTAMLIPKDQLAVGQLAALRAILNLQLRDKAKLQFSN